MDVAVFDLPPAFQSVLDAWVEVVDAGDLVLYKPEGGAVDVPAVVQRHGLTVSLLPKGSGALLDPPQLEAMIARLSNALSRPSDVVPGQPRAKPDLTASLREWAQRNGFRSEEVEEKLRIWLMESARTLVRPPASGR